MRFSAKNVLMLAAASACVCMPFAGMAEGDEKAAAEDVELKTELRYIDALVNAGMPDFAEPVIAAAKKKWPNAGPKLKVLELKGDLQLGKFENVQKVVDSLKGKKGQEGEYWALRLEMANFYNAYGKTAECRKIYGEFFKTVTKPGPDLIDFYVESGFTWAQMCVNEKNFDEAVRMYDSLLAKDKNVPEERWCTVAMEDVELLLRLASEITVDPKAKNAKDLAAKRKGYLDRATKIVDELLWKQELIIVFGKAVAMKAHIFLLRGDLAKAQELVNEYMPQLSEIHRSLVEQDPEGNLGYVRMSPMPECRYMLAKVLWEGVQAETKKPKANEDVIKDSLFGAKQGNKRNGSGAYNHAINVFVKYPESTWAVNAGELTETIAKFVKERYNKEIKTNITPAQMKKVRQMQFAGAYRLFRDNDFKKAAMLYEELIARFPDMEESVGAAGILAECYINLWQSVNDKKEKEEMRAAADKAENILTEQFSAKAEFTRAAGDEVLRLAAKERDLGALARSQQLYDAYFKHFPTHYNAATLAQSLAAKAYQGEDWETAARWYGLVATSYTNSTYYAPALQFLAACCGKTGDTDGQAKWLRQFAGVTKKPYEKSTSLLSLALLQQKAGFAAFAAAAETNEEARAEIQKTAAIKVIKAIQDLAATAKIAGEAAVDKNTEKGLVEKFNTQREQALFLQGDSWSRLQTPIGKMTVETFHAKAVKAYEDYLAAYPQGRYGAQALVKIGTIHTADKKMEESQKAFARLQSDFPESDEAKNSVPRLAKTLIEMGLRNEGVEQYKQMLSAGGKYNATQFLQAGDALLEAKGWDVASEAYTKAIDLSKALTNKAAQAYVVTKAALGQAKSLFGQKRFAEAHQALDAFIEKNAKSALVIEAYEMLVEVASEEGRKEKDDTLRLKSFNAAVGAIKKLRGFRKNPAEIDLLDLRSGDVLIRKIDAEEAMGLKEQARETCGQAVVTFQAFLMAHEPNAEHPAKDMTPAQLNNLERCYSTVLPLMAKLGKEQSEKILEYGGTYLELFPDGKHKLAVQNAMNQAKADR